MDEIEKSDEELAEEVYKAVQSLNEKISSAWAKKLRVEIDTNVFSFVGLPNCPRVIAEVFRPL